jgi:catechol 2,3-dioxygenase-like lactoylglutathione lyase family enzyme
MARPLKEAPAMSETAKPPVGVGHLALTVAEVGASRRFYTTLGLRIVGRADDMSILELRGGAHLLLFQRGGPSAGTEGPFDQARPNAVDLMIEGRTFEELDSYRTALIAGGVQPDPISDKLLRPLHLQGPRPRRQRGDRLDEPRHRPADLAGGQPLEAAPNVLGDRRDRA